MSTENWAVARDVSGIAGGALSHGDVLNALIFRAGAAASATDLIVAFFADDLGRLDWLGDYIMDRRLLEALDSVDDAEAEEDPMFNKKDMPAGSGDALYD